jgi:hypothetical protein
MLRIDTKTKLTPEEAIKKAVDFFGPGGYKLKIKSQTPLSVNFEGEVGFVSVAAGKEKGKTAVELATSEWESQVEEFILKIH